MTDESHNVYKFQSKPPLGCALHFEGPEIISLVSLGEAKVNTKKMRSYTLEFPGTEYTALLRIEESPDRQALSYKGLRICSIRYRGISHLHLWSWRSW